MTGRYRRWALRFLAWWALYAAAIGLLARMGADGLGWDIFWISTIVVLAAVCLNVFLSREPHSGGGEFWLRIATIVVLAATLVLAAPIVVGSGATMFVTIAAIYFAVGQVLLEVRTATWGAPWRGFAVLAICGTAAAEGLRSLAAGSHMWGYVAVAASILVAPVGVMLVSDDWGARVEHLGLSRRRAMILAGIGAVVVGHLLLPHNLPGPTLVGTFLLALIVGGIVSNTDLDVVVVVIVVGVVTAWALEPRVEHDLATISVAADEPAIVALGDSFMSGEGASKYYEGTNVKNGDECRRAPSAYAVKTVELSTVQQDKLVFLACSGARADDVYAPPLDDAAAQGEKDATDPDQLTQFRQVEADIGPQVELVILSVGGNDANFGTIGKTCVMPGDCSEVGQRWLDRLPDVGRKLSEVYAAVDGVFGDVPVVVVPYPIPLDEDGCSWSTMVPAEHRFLHRYTEELNAVVRHAAAEARFYFLGKMKDAFVEDELRICDQGPGEVGVNFLAGHSVEGLLDDRVNPLNWFHNSLHPNAAGHEAMSDVLEEWILTHDGVKARKPAADDPAPEIPSLEVLMGVPDLPHCGNVSNTPKTCNATADEWAGGRVGRMLGRLGSPVLLIALGAWALWLGVLGNVKREP